MHHFVMSKLAGIHQQAKLVDEFQMFSESSIGQSKSLLYPMNQSRLDRLTAIAIYEASNMRENHWNPQSQSRLGYEFWQMQRLVHTRCLVDRVSYSREVTPISLELLSSLTQI